jgi:hypothetical protein
LRQDAFTGDRRCVRLERLLKRHQRINGGGGSSDKCFDFVRASTGALVSEDRHNATGGTLGGQPGYRWQSTNWVLDAARRVLQRIAS